MNEEMILAVGSEAIKTTIFLAGPLLLAAMIVGIVVSIFQAITQINEATLTFIPKMIAMILVLIILAPWMLKVAQEYTTTIYDNMSEWAQ